ncbi:1651_t:CDS:2, partial [Racocetra persica]
RKTNKPPIDNKTEIIVEEEKKENTEASKKKKNKEVLEKKKKAQNRDIQDMTLDTDKKKKA